MRIQDFHNIQETNFKKVLSRGIFILVNTIRVSHDLEDKSKGAIDAVLGWVCVHHA